MSKCGVPLVGPSGDRLGLVASVHSNRRPPLRMRRWRRPQARPMWGRLHPNPHSRREARAARLMIVAGRRGKNGRSVMTAITGWSAKTSARIGKATPLVVNDRGANAAIVSSGQNANSITQSPRAAVRAGATSSRIRTPHSPSLPRSNSNWNRRTKSRLEHQCQEIRTSAYRQMAVACPDGADPDRCRGAYDGRVRSGQRQAHDVRQPPVASWRCGDGCA